MDGRAPRSGLERGVIELRGLSKRFGDRVALEPVDLAVRPGEVVALVGPNGAGKSTLLRMLAGGLVPGGGSAAIAGHDVVRDPIASRRALGYLPQRLGVPLTTVVGDLIALVAGVRGLALAQARAALLQAGLAERGGATLAELSGGQRQRLMIACATLGDIRALLLDEPSISLDAEGADEVRESIAAAARGGAAVLFASHHLHDVALLADRIVVMVAGRVVASGTLEALAAAADVPWRPGSERIDPPIERIYRVLVGRGRQPEQSLRLLPGTAA